MIETESVTEIPLRFAPCHPSIRAPSARVAQARAAAPPADRLTTCCCPAPGVTAGASPASAGCTRSTATPPPAIVAPCTQGLRHSDPTHAHKTLTAAAASAATPPFNIRYRECLGAGRGPPLRRRGMEVEDLARLGRRHHRRRRCAVVQLQPAQEKQRQHLCQH
eukprot:SAG25_NODE_347_length_9358_cov_86.358315_7_plen_164_part_00